MHMHKAFLQMYAYLCVYMWKASSLVHSARTTAQHSTLQLLLQCICLISFMCLDSQVTPLTCLYRTLKTIFQMLVKGNCKCLKMNMK